MRLPGRVGSSVKNQVAVEGVMVMIKTTGGIVKKIVVSTIMLAGGDQSSRSRSHDNDSKSDYDSHDSERSYDMR